MLRTPVAVDSVPSGTPFGYTLMSITLNETFRVSAAPDRVWAFLKDPAQVVTCLPGAELTETIDEKTYGGRVKVKVGPIAAAYAGRATLAQVDDAARRMQIVAEGKESGGSGQARMTMTGHVTALEDGGSQVSVDAQIDIAGRVMQFGRGLIESVNKQLFKQFADAVQSKLAESPTESVAVTPAKTSEVAPTDPPAAPAALSTTRATLAEPATGVLSPAPVPLPEAALPVYPRRETPRASEITIAKGEELRIIPLLWNVLVDFLKGLFGRRR